MYSYEVRLSTIRTNQMRIRLHRQTFTLSYWMKNGRGDPSFSTCFESSGECVTVEKDFLPEPGSWTLWTGIQEIPLTSGTGNEVKTSLGIGLSCSAFELSRRVAAFFKPSGPKNSTCLAIRSFSCSSIWFARSADGLPTTTTGGGSM